MIARTKLGVSGAATFLLLTLLAAPVVAQTSVDPLVNEFVANHTGADTSEFVEVAGSAATDYSAFAVLEIEGDGSGAGIVDGVFGVGTTNADGYWTTGFLNNQIENGTLTLLLVEGFTGSAGSDLDGDNDGALDARPWSRLVDGIAVLDGHAGDVTYAEAVLTPGFDGNTFTPGGASRIPDATDTDTVADWTRNDFDGAGLPGFTGLPAPGEALNTPGAANTTEPPGNGDGTGACGDEATAIHDVQGAGAASPLEGDRVVVEGVVVGDFQDGDPSDAGDLDGFYVQEEDRDADGDPATSEGVFVFAADDDVAAGDVVRVQGTVAEFVTSGGASSMTQLAGVSAVQVCASGAPLPTPATVELPVASPDAFERVEGMRAVFPQALVISEYFNYDRFGEIVLSLPFAGQDRLYQPTALVEPGTEANALQAQIGRRRITLDDGQRIQNPAFNRHPDGDEFTLDNRFRGGDTVANAVGVIDDTFGRYRIQPTAGAKHVAVNPRPPAPEDVGGGITVATLNVLNYFLTTDQGLDECGPGRNQGCRGADNANELSRQRAKILAALVAMNADVFGLIEMENTTGVEPLADLVDGLNTQLGAGTYAYIDTGTIGGDAIKVGIIYKPGSVSPIGDFAILDSSVDSRFLDDFNRPVLAQTFADTAGGVFTVAVNHLKSKGSPCVAVGDPDAGDGQGNCNLTRTRAAEAMVDWLAGDPTGSGDRDVLIVGDLNSYDKEDPIDAVVEGPDDQLGTGDDYTDLLLRSEGELAYTFVFDGLFGYLDYALSSSTMSGQVTGATAWHINADEPDILDYDTSFKSDVQDALYEPNAFRSSDHDPVIVGLDLNASPSCTAAAADPERLFPPNHRFVPIDVTGVTDAEGDPVTITVDSIMSDEAVDAPGSGSTAPDGRGVGTSTAQVRAERAGDGNGRVYHIGFTATDALGGSCTAEVTVEVPVGRKADVVDDGPLFDATAVP